jgi:hypothetical protein
MKTKPRWAPSLLLPLEATSSGGSSGKRMHHHERATLAVALRRKSLIRGEELDLAWAAGFFDGEGCIGASSSSHAPSANGSPRKPSIRLFAVVTQNNHEVLERFQEICGIHGRIRSMKRTPTQNRQCYSLIYDGVHALTVIYLLRPYLLRKQHEADAAKDMAVNGKLGMYPGPRGLPAAVDRARHYGRAKLSRLK